MGKTRVQKYSQSRTSNPFEFTKLLNHNVGRYIFNVMDQEEFRGFSAHPLQRITTLREVLDNPSFLNLSSNDPSNGPKGNADEEEDWLTRDYEIKEQDRWLPLANVGRVMKAALPPQAKLSKDSKMCMQECVSEFISFITSAAADKCFDENRKTLNGEDLLYALYTLGFENYAETLKIYLAKYRQNESLNAEERRRKDRLKRRLRKERKEVEFRETNERFGYQFQQDERHSSEESTGGLTAVKSAFRGYENDMKSDNDVINPNDINQS